MISMKTRWNALRLGPGQGKSFIMLLMAKYFNEHESLKSVFITS